MTWQYPAAAPDGHPGTYCVQLLPGRMCLNVREGALWRERCVSCAGSEPLVYP